MKNNFLLTISLLFSLSITTFAQEEIDPTRILHSFDAAFELGVGGGDFGIQIKGNHWWLKHKKLVVQSGLSYQIFAGPERINATQSDAGGFTMDNHLRLYTGIEQSFFKQDILYVFFEAYIGMYHSYTNGRYQHPALEQELTYQSSEVLVDYGTRLGFGVRIKERWGIQLSLQNSWRQVNNGLGPLVGMLVGGPDGKMSIGLGLNYRL